MLTLGLPLGVAVVYIDELDLIALLLHHLRPVQLILEPGHELYYTNILSVSRNDSFSMRCRFKQTDGRI